MTQIITDNLEISVTHNIGVPDTGAAIAPFDATTPMEYLVVGFGVAMLVLSIVFLILRKKSKLQLTKNMDDFYLKKRLRNRQWISGGLFGISVCVFWFLVSGLAVAASETIATKLPVAATITGEIAKANVNLTLDADYTNGYNVYAMIQGDGKLYNTNKTASIAMTNTEASDAVATNSFGVSFLSEDGVVEKYGAIATGEGTTTMTKIFSTEQAATAGTVVNLSYLANLNTETVIGDYTGEIIYYVTECNLAATSIENAVCMQDMNAAVKDSMVTGTKYTLKDNRDNQSYAVAKLADGKIWLLDNLALDLTDSSVQANLTSVTTNASDIALGYLKNGGGTTADQYATSGVTEWTSGYSYSDPLINVASKDVIPSGAPSGSFGGNKVGVYYNYCATSAGSYCYGDGTNPGSASGDATEDICPKGWHMPIGSSGGEYEVLDDAYSNDVDSFRAALSAPLSGYFYDGSAGHQGVYGYIWSSTYYYGSGMSILNYSPGGSNPTFADDRGFGESVRCVAQ